MGVGWRGGDAPYLIQTGAESCGHKLERKGTLINTECILTRHLHVFLEQRCLSRFCNLFSFSFRCF